MRGAQAEDGGKAMSERRLYRVRVTNEVFFVSEPKFADFDARLAIRDAAHNDDEPGELEIDERPAGTPVAEIPKDWRGALPYLAIGDERDRSVEDWISEATQTEAPEPDPRQLEIPGSAR